MNPRRTVRQVLTRSVELLGGAGPVTELAASVGLGPELLDRRPNQLSGGQKQRVAIARILDLLLDLQIRSGIALLFITHDLTVARRPAGRIGVLDEGRLVEIGTTEQIFTAPHPVTRSLLAAAHRRPAVTA